MRIFLNLGKVLAERNVLMKFTKMHGVGNDYVYVNAFKEKLENPAEVAKKISDRHFGVGSEGLVLILRMILMEIYLIYICG